MYDELIRLISDAARATADEQGLEVPSDLDADSALFGEGGLLDSLALVSMVVAVEQTIAQRFDASIELADDRALSQRHSPYRTIGALARYAAGQIETGKG